MLCHGWICTFISLRSHIETVPRNSKAQDNPRGLCRQSPWFFRKKNRNLRCPSYHVVLLISSYPVAGSGSAAFTHVNVIQSLSFAFFRPRQQQILPPLVSSSAKRKGKQKQKIHENLIYKKSLQMPRRCFAGETKRRKQKKVKSVKLNFFFRFIPPERVSRQSRLRKFFVSGSEKSAQFIILNELDSRDDGGGSGMRTKKTETFFWQE